MKNSPLYSIQVGITVHIITINVCRGRAAMFYISHLNHSSLRNFAFGLKLLEIFSQTRSKAIYFGSFAHSCSPQQSAISLVSGKKLLGVSTSGQNSLITRSLLCRDFINFSYIYDGMVVLQLIFTSIYSCQVV